MAGKKTILIVDDDVLASDRLKSFLEGHGFSVVQATDGVIALKLIEGKAPDLIVLDIVMPKMDGFTVAKELRYNDKTKQIPIIILSAKEGMKELFAIEGINDYMIKPVDNEGLLGLIRQRVNC